MTGYSDEQIEALIAAATPGAMGGPQPAGQSERLRLVVGLAEAPLDVFNYYGPATAVYRVSLAGLAQAHVGFVSARVDRSKAQTVAGAASNTGDYSAASNTGDCSAASTTGDRSAASNTGCRSAASNTGHYSAASNTGYRSAASVEGAESIAIVTGKDSRASGAEGCWIVLTERDDDWHILGVKAVKVGSRVNGVRVEPGVFYELRGGKVAAVSS